MNLFHSISFPRTLPVMGIALLLAAAPACAQFTTTAPKSFKSPVKKMTPSTASASPSANTAATPQTGLDTLDVIGLGLSVEMFRQIKVWDEMQKNPNGTLLPTDPKKYPWSAQEKDQIYDKRSA